MGEGCGYKFAGVLMFALSGAVGAVEAHEERRKRKENLPSMVRQEIFLFGKIFQ
jgi:hypothetical protein